MLMRVNDGGQWIIIVNYWSFLSLSTRSSSPSLMTGEMTGWSWRLLLLDLWSKVWLSRGCLQIIRASNIYQKISLPVTSDKLIDRSKGTFGLSTNIFSRQCRGAPRTITKYTAEINNSDWGTYWQSIFGARKFSECTSPLSGAAP